jgi:hypothetical protein
MQPIFSKTTIKANRTSEKILFFIGNGSTPLFWGHDDQGEQWDPS